MDHTERYERLLAQAQKEFGLVIEEKADHWYWRVLGALLTLVTFGKVDFMNSFFTTIGNKIGTTPSWDRLYDGEKYEILLHELEHVKQYKAAGFGNVWFGFVVASIGYLFLPFPIGLAWCRASMEMAGYTQTIRALIQLYGVQVALLEKSRIVSQFTSVNYLFMWPFKGYVERWFDETVKKVAAEEGEVMP
jgi:hypothetical protein